MPFMNEITSLTEAGISKDMPPSESNVTTTSPSLMDANSVFLTFEEKAQ